jgi:uncharacterized caspase-like protein
MGNNLFNEDKRLALVIACSNYNGSGHLKSLPKVVNDANVMEIFLKSIGFKVAVSLDEELVDIEAKYNRVLIEAKS